MALAPTEIGYNGNQVRAIAQSQIDRITELLLDPTYVESANKAKSKGLADGSFYFEFIFDGQLNANEEETLTTDWAASGWTSVLFTNNQNNPHDSPDNKRWKFTLIKEA